MSIHSTRFLVIAVAGIVAIVGAAFTHLDARRNEAELRAKTERLTIESADSLGRQLEEAAETVHQAALQTSLHGGASGLKTGAAKATASLPKGLVVFHVSRGQVVAAFPAESEAAQFRGLPFEDLSKDVGASSERDSEQLVAEGPFRLAGGGWAIVVRAPLRAGLSSFGDWMVAAPRGEALIQSVGLTRLPGLGFHYELSYRDPESGGKRSFLASSDAPLADPVERKVRFHQTTWALAVAPRGGWYAWSPILIHSGLVLIFVLFVAILTHDLAQEPEHLRQELAKRDRRLQEANRKWMRAAQQLADLEKQISHASFHDSLTGLPNRAYFVNHLERALRRARRQPNLHLAVIVLNLDRFKNVSDSLGHAAGDSLLIQAAHRLERCVRPADLTVAKLGNDELAFLLFDIPTPDAAKAVAERLQQALAEPFLLEGQNVFVTASMGIAVSAMGCDTADELIRASDIALSKAKAQGGAAQELFDPAIRDQIVSSQQLENDLRRAIEQWEFRLYFQPIVSLHTGRIAGMEVLVRWHHPLEGILAPGRFIRLAEETGLIVPLNRAIARAACQQAKVWRETLPRDISFYMSVNLTASDLRQADLCDFFAGLLQETGLPRETLRAEVTESSMISNVELASELVSRLRAMGIPLLLDDFGTGYSSLSYLQLFKFDYLKIDIAFVRRVTPTGQNLGMIRAIVNMAKELGIETIAEGIEQAYVMKHLQSAGCNYGQGYYFSKPVQADVMERLLRSQEERSLLGEAGQTPVSRLA